MSVLDSFPTCFLLVSSVAALARMSSLATARLPADDITRDQLELLKAKFDVLQGERKAYFET